MRTDEITRVDPDGKVVVYPSGDVSIPLESLEEAGLTLHARVAFFTSEGGFGIMLTALGGWRLQLRERQPKRRFVKARGALRKLGISLDETSYYEVKSAHGGNIELRKIL